MMVVEDQFAADVHDDGSPLRTGSVVDMGDVARNEDAKSMGGSTLPSSSSVQQSVSQHTESCNDSDASWHSAYASVTPAPSAYYKEDTYVANEQFDFEGNSGLGEDDADPTTFNVF